MTSYQIHNPNKNIDFIPSPWLKLKINFKQNYDSKVLISCQVHQSNLNINFIPSFSCCFLLVYTPLPPLHVQLLHLSRLYDLYHNAFSTLRTCEKSSTCEYYIPLSNNNNSSYIWQAQIKQLGLFHKTSICVGWKSWYSLLFQSFSHLCMTQRCVWHKENQQ